MMETAHDSVYLTTSVLPSPLSLSLSTPLHVCVCARAHTHTILYMVYNQPLPESDLQA